MHLTCLIPAVHLVDRGAGGPWNITLTPLPLTGQLLLAPSSGVLKHNTKKLPPSFIPKTKRNLVCLLAKLRPPAQPSSWALGMCRHVLCVCLHVSLRVFWEHRLLTL